jgi:hypothetical protein
MVIGLALAWGPIRDGAIQIHEAKLIMAAWIMGPLLFSIALLMMLPGSLYERCGVGDG